MYKRNSFRRCRLYSGQVGGIGQPSFKYIIIKWLSFTCVRHTNHSVCDDSPHRGKKVFDLPFQWTLEQPCVCTFVQWGNPYLFLILASEILKFAIRLTLCSNIFLNVILTQHSSSLRENDIHNIHQNIVLINDNYFGVNVFGMQQFTTPLKSSTNVIFLLIDHISKSNRERQLGQSVTNKLK